MSSLPKEEGEELKESETEEELEEEPSCKLVQIL